MRARRYGTSTLAEAEMPCGKRSQVRGVKLMESIERSEGVTHATQNGVYGSRYISRREGRGETPLLW